MRASSSSSASFTTCSGRQLAARIHSHVQRPVGPKTKSSVRLVQLQAAHAKVSEQAVQRSRRNHFSNLGKRPRYKFHRRHFASEFFAHRCQPLLASSIACGSRSNAINLPLLPSFRAMTAEWPPSPSVASTTTLPGCTFRKVKLCSKRTGTCCGPAIYPPHASRWGTLPNSLQSRF